jgi:hypothetical protein
VWVWVCDPRNGASSKQETWRAPRLPPSPAPSLCCCCFHSEEVGCEMHILLLIIPSLGGGNGELGTSTTSGGRSAYWRFVTVCPHILTRPASTSAPPYHPLPSYCWSAVCPTCLMWSAFGVQRVDDHPPLEVMPQVGSDTLPAGWAYTNTNTPTHEHKLSQTQTKRCRAQDGRAEGWGLRAKRACTRRCHAHTSTCTKVNDHAQAETHSYIHTHAHEHVGASTRARTYMHTHAHKHPRTCRYAATLVGIRTRTRRYMHTLTPADEYT